MSTSEETARFSPRFADVRGSYTNEFSEYKPLIEEGFHLIAAYATLGRTHTDRVMGIDREIPAKERKVAGDGAGAGSVSCVDYQI